MNVTMHSYFLFFVVILALSSRPWLCYWILHSVALLGKSADAAFEDRTIDFLSRCQV